MFHECSDKCLPPIHIDMGFTQVSVALEDYRNTIKNVLQEFNIVVVDIKELIPKLVFRTAWIWYPPSVYIMEETEG